MVDGSKQKTNKELNYSMNGNWDEKCRFFALSTARFQPEHLYSKDDWFAWDRYIDCVIYLFIKCVMLRVQTKNCHIFIRWDDVRGAYIHIHTHIAQCVFIRFLSMICEISLELLDSISWLFLSFQSHWHFSMKSKASIDKRIEIRALYKSFARLHQKKTRITLNDDFFCVDILNIRESCEWICCVQENYVCWCEFQSNIWIKFTEKNWFGYAEDS